MARPPEGVVHVELDVDVNGNPCSIGFWLLVPDAGAASFDYWRGLAGAVELELGGPFLACMHSGASFVTCRLGVGGAPPFSFVDGFAPNHGAWTGGQAQNVAAGVYVQTFGGGKGSGSRIHFPAVPDIFIDSNARLTQLGLGNLQHAAEQLRDFPLTVTGPTGASVLLGTLQTRRHGAALMPPVFDPAIGVRPSFAVETLRRRLPRRGHVSPH